MAASTSTSAASSRGIYWPDRVVTLLLEAVREKESLWNTKSEAYKNRNVKKAQYEEVLQVIKEELPDVDLASLKGKIQSLRTFYREEVRKIKKSQGTGSGASDVYVSKWKFFDECSFLDEVIYSNRQVFTNVRDEDSSPGPGGEEEQLANYDNADTESESNVSVKSASTTYTTKRKRSDDNPLLESATSALNQLAKNAASAPEDEWDIFGKDVASSIRHLGDKDLQRRVKFAVQSAIFQATEPPRVPYQHYYQRDDSFSAQLQQPPY
ncbi:uncharacterized protein [Montipora capricornis]|uniref:uncharacterized protein n=1 Tax=Montipora capricornis TaxID=246305 RepID=UPI0035F1B3DE